ncbi:type II toxin-antitoxin system prevent-host-death family antitoxin [Rhizorhapis sp. SPR117]|nr:type II toxin-antitoxin system prevent-host-death family antitoxin [Rhizorhapis sp. SPR117]
MLIDVARAEPVTVEKHGRPVVVVMSVEEYKRLVAQGDAERLDRAFQPLQQVHSHEGLKAALAVSLAECAAAALHFGIVKLRVSTDTAGQDVADRRIDREFEHGQAVKYLIKTDHVRATG